MENTFVYKLEDCMTEFKTIDDAIDHAVKNSKHGLEIYAVRNDGWSTFVGIVDQYLMG